MRRYRHDNSRAYVELAIIVIGLICLIITLVRG